MGWTNAIGKKITVFILVLFIVLYMVFPGKIYSIDWIAAAIMISILTIAGIRMLSNSRGDVKERSFIYKLFWSALIIRIVAMFVLLLISYKTWSMFFVVGARDEMVYYRIASEAVDIWKDQSISNAYLHIYCYLYYQN